jgi:hypothetical protein
LQSNIRDPNPTGRRVPDHGGAVAGTRG